MATPTPTPLPFKAVLAALAVAPWAVGCGATEGDILRTPSDAAALAARPRPAVGATYQIQLNGDVDTTVDANVYSIDLTSSAQVISDLHAKGGLLMCHFSAGTYEPFRDDAALFPQAALGDAVPDYSSERWLDVRDAGVRALMQARIEFAAHAGCDGIHPTNLDGYLQTTGFPISESDQMAYDRWIAGYAHGLGLSAGLVDGDAVLASALVADFDWAVVWSCVDVGCDAAPPFVAAHKPVFAVEYGSTAAAATVCPEALALGVSAVIKNQSLDAFRGGCP